MVMPPRSSTGLQSIRRELQRRKANPLAPARPPAKIPSAPPPSPRSSVASPSMPPPPPSRSCAACPDTPGAAAHLKPGTAVLVRTRTVRLRMGKTLVLWLPATVVSAADDGVYEVVYKGEWPRGDPFAAVHVARNHVRLPKPSPPPAPTPPPQPPSGSATSSSKSSEIQPAPRPTTAGKSIRLVRELFPEIERQAAGAILPGY